MTPKTRRHASRIALALTLFASSASAQSGPSPSTVLAPLSQSLQGPAKDAYESGRLLAANHDFVGALAKFQQAYSFSNEPRLLFNMAVCNKELRHYARMQSLLLKYVHDAGPSLSGDGRTAVDQALVAIRPLVATVRLTVNESSAAVSVDGEPVGTTPLAEPLAVDLGKHTLTVKKQGFDTSEQTIDTPGGETTSLSVALVAEKNAGHLVVTSDEGATVFIDGSVAGKGHFEGQLEPGTHRVRVTESGKTPFASEVALREGETRTMEVTLESSEHHALVWPWIVGGVVLAAGAAVGGYFLFKPSDQTGPPPDGKLGSVSFALSGAR
jgi:hypothetical protein